MASEWVMKRDRAKYLSGYEWALIIDALAAQPGKMFHILSNELAAKGLADN